VAAAQRPKRAGPSRGGRAAVSELATRPPRSTPERALAGELVDPGGLTVRAAEVAARQRSPETRRTYAAVYRAFGAFLGPDAAPADLTPEAVRASSPPASGSTAGRARGCSGCSTWRWPTATSARSTPSTTTATGRPVSAIRAADTDGNPDTSAGPTWTPLVTTPPIPDYDSAHAVEGGAAAAVFRRFFGTDRIAFRTCSLTLPAGSTCDDAAPRSRSYSTFTEAAEENGTSRILIGFHFRKAVREGIDRGRRIGGLAADRYLLPAQRRRPLAHRTTTTSAGGGSCFLAKEQSWPPRGSPAHCCLGRTGAVSRRRLRTGAALSLCANLSTRCGVTLDACSSTTSCERSMTPS
jgi:hypothetical protein